MLTSYLNGNVSNLDPIAEGGLFNKGEGIEMALDVGADTSGEFSKFHAEPSDPRAEDAPDPAIMAFPYGILVNKHGERFVDEGEKTVDEHYEYVARRIWEQPDEIAYLISDQKLYDVPKIEHAIATPEDPFEGTPDYAGSEDPLSTTVRDLADTIDVDSTTLLETVQSYNDSITDADFDPFTTDGKRAETTPPKSNWAQPLDTPPFVAYPVRCANVFTFGGVAIDTKGRVLSPDDQPIPGLYAAGEVTGLYYGKYTGATSVLRGLVFGRIAGQHAVDSADTRLSQ
jgi:tricarballylate dehydrogenase